MLVKCLKSPDDQIPSKCCYHSVLLCIYRERASREREGERESGSGLLLIRT